MMARVQFLYLPNLVSYPCDINTVFPSIKHLSLRCNYLLTFYRVTYKLHEVKGHIYFISH